MKAFTAPLMELGEFEDISQRLLESRGGVEQITGCIDCQKPHFIFALGKKQPIRLILTYSELRARELYERYRLFDRKVYLFPAKDLIFYQADLHGNVLEQQRIAVFKALTEESQVTVITTMGACMNHMVPFSEWQDQIQVVETGSELDLKDMAERLRISGYERTEQVEAPGQFTIRGGILDVYPLPDENPVRIELWGDEVDSIRRFDVETQRSIENLQQVYLYPASELIPDADQKKRVWKKLEKEEKTAEEDFRSRFQPEQATNLRQLLSTLQDALQGNSLQGGLESLIDYIYEKPVGFLSYFPEKKTILFLDEPNRLKEHADSIELEFRESMIHRLEKGYLLPGQAGLLFSCQEICAELSLRHSVGLCMLEQIHAPWVVDRKYNLDVRSVNSYNNSFPLLVQDLQKWKKDGYRVILLAASRSRGKRLCEELQEEQLNCFYTEDLDHEVQPGQLLITHGSVSRGYEYPMIKFIVIAESDIFGKEKRRRKKYQGSAGKQMLSYTDLSVGDYVVHENYGIGIYRGVEKIEVDHVTKDYIKIEYAGNSYLYELTTRMDVIQKYADADAKPPKLNKMGGQEWGKTREKVRSAVQVVAQDLVNLYAARSHSQGHIYGQDTVWQKEFEEMFPYEETDDQLRAIEAVKKDMESPRIMDRLVCGDVGFGKTEIAIRAAFKAVQEGKQVAYLVPTTILAQQHYTTFVQRMKDFPVRVDLLCRFRTAAEQKKTLKDLERGMVDIVIGTHRLLSKDVKFKNLGMLIIDEEQRFGVRHKEKIKQLKTNVDVLTLTATPIPRTLHMSLIGIRDMSILDEAPQERLPIQTYVMEYNEEMVREAISRELARGGQVYYVFNRVNTIADVAASLEKMLPQAQITYAHGQMEEKQLENIMYDFINGEIDVLVTTTIIETGLDIPNVNTIIIHDADKMGLSQLYQLRGRVGRSNRTSYAFLMYQRDKLLREVAEKRLSAIREFTDLGSGFKIAMRDLEIRGAGNLLGGEQHGHMAAVGYDLYCKLLGEAVREVQGIPAQNSIDTEIILNTDAYIPERYIINELQKLEIYKKIASIHTEEDQEEMLEELLDRYGEPPKAVQNLLRVALLRARAQELDLTEIRQEEDQLVFRFYQAARINPAPINDLLKSWKGRLRFVSRLKEAPCFVYNRKMDVDKSRKDSLRLAEEVITSMQVLKREEGS